MNNVQVNILVNSEIIASGFGDHILTAFRRISPLWRELCLQNNVSEFEDEFVSENGDVVSQEIKVTINN